MTDDLYTLFSQIRGNAQSLTGLKGSNVGRRDTIVSLSEHGMDLTVSAPPPDPDPDPPPPLPVGSSRMGISTGGGWHTFSQSTVDSHFDKMKAQGVAWVRFDINWAAIQSSSASNFNWTGHDRLVDAAGARGIKVLGIIDGCPGWAHPGQSSAWAPPTNPATYATFCGIVAARYATRNVHHYEVWNEPNIPPFWSTGPNVAAYTALLKAAAPALRASDSSVFIVSAGLAPASDGTNISPRTFATGMYANGAKGSFDAFGMHPYCSGIRPSTFASWSAWSQMNRTSPSIRSIMDDNGDGAKSIWPTEFGAATGGTGGTIVSEAEQAAVLTDAYTVAKADALLGPLFWFTYQDKDGSDRWYHAGLLRVDGSAKPAWDVYKTEAAK